MSPLDRRSILQSAAFSRPQAEALLKLMDTAASAGDNDIDGGVASSVYLADQFIDGGSA